MASNSVGRSRTAGATVLFLAALLLGGCASWFRPAEPEKVTTVIAVATEGDLEAGAAAVDISPDEAGLKMGGYRVGRDSTGNHDPLFARALVLKRGDHEQVLVAVDLVGLFRPFVREALAEVIEVPIDQIVVASTHDHSSPDSMGIWGHPPFTSGLDEKFMAKVRRGIVQSIRDARAKLAPAEIGYATTAVDPDEFIKNVNRKHLVDPESTVIHVRARGPGTTNGATIATVVELGCHPEVVPEDNTLVSADFPGYAVRALEREFGGVGIYVSGDLGALVSPVRHRKPEEPDWMWEEARRIGERLAGYASDAVKTIREYESAPRLAAYRSPIFLDNENFYFHVMEFTGVLDRPIYGNGYIETEVNLWEIGKLRIATVPGEISPDLGMRIRKICGHPAMILGLANDELGYLFPSYDFDLALYDYERTLSVGKYAADRLLRWIEDLVNYANFSQQIHDR
jgi:hypothetical protein